MKATAEPTLFDRFFRDPEGNIVIAQKPNLPILIWGATTALQFLNFGGKFQTGLELVSFGILFTWAWLEIFQGVNYFRRSLGLVVLVGMLALSL
ncbi:hypothetical protein [Leptolyngbya sp. NIES-2104]|uniref:hypothetical protein n=1 Tax=Leptolyngbya sp. NIES-2104 TaxID=1552121 RepID=UPI0006ECB21B|nr:hypothetical protein [Leptolyngbya sp. NIES-2104]GAP98478.1 hypothetical protein NIES2104_50330 [Leptolyngbya sp. NIES-2104]